MAISAPFAKWHSIRPSEKRPGHSMPSSHQRQPETRRTRLRHGNSWQKNLHSRHGSDIIPMRDRKGMALPRVGDRQPKRKWLVQIVRPARMPHTVGCAASNLSGGPARPRRWLRRRVGGSVLKIADGRSSFDPQSGRLGLRWQGQKFVRPARGEPASLKGTRFGFFYRTVRREHPAGLGLLVVSARPARHRATG
jgi:hypothetical protein